jgi:hypothetical protein
VPSGAQTVLEDTISIISGTVDATGAALPQRASITLTLRRPIDGLAADVSAVQSIIADVIYSDEWANTILTQEFLK